MGLLDFWRRWQEEGREMIARQEALEAQVGALPMDRARHLVDRLLADRDYVTTKPALAGLQRPEALAALSLNNRELFARCGSMTTRDRSLTIDRVEHGSGNQLNGLLVLGLAWLELLIVCLPGEDPVWGVTGEHRPEERAETIQPSLHHFILSVLASRAPDRLEALLGSDPGPLTTSAQTLGEVRP